MLPGNQRRAILLELSDHCDHHDARHRGGGLCVREISLRGQERAFLLNHVPAADSNADPLYRIVTYMGLNASLIGVIIPNLANAFGI